MLLTKGEFYGHGTWWQNVYFSFNLKFSFMSNKQKKPLSFHQYPLVSLCVCVCVCVCYLISVSDYMWPHGLWPTRLLCPWSSSGKKLEWVAIPFSGLSWESARTKVERISRQLLVSLGKSVLQICLLSPYTVVICRIYTIATSFILFYLFTYFISWRLITLQYCSGSCHTLTWISNGYTRIPHPDHPSHLPLHLIPLGLPSAPGLSTCLMHPTWAGDLFHPR